MPGDVVLGAGALKDTGDAVRQRGDGQGHALMDRRTHLAALAAFAAAILPARQVKALERIMEEIHPQYGLIGQIVAQPGQRAALAAILTEDTDRIPGNFVYLVGEDAGNPDALWVVELWADKEAHAASLALPQVKAAIARGRPLIAEFGTRAEFKPVANAAA